MQLAAAFDRRCIPARSVAPPSNIARYSQSSRLATGAPHRSQYGAGSCTTGCYDANALTKVVGAGRSFLGGIGQDLRAEEDMLHRLSEELAKHHPETGFSPFGAGGLAYLFGGPQTGVPLAIAEAVRKRFRLAPRVVENLCTSLTNRFIYSTICATSLRATTGCDRKWLQADVGWR